MTKNRDKQICTTHLTYSKSVSTILPPNELDMTTKVTIQPGGRNTKEVSVISLLMNLKSNTCIDKFLFFAIVKDDEHNWEGVLSTGPD